MPLRYEFMVDADEQARASAVVRRRHWLYRYDWWIVGLAVLIGAWLKSIGAYWSTTMWMFGPAAALVVMRVLTPAVEGRQLRRLHAEVPGMDVPQVHTFSDAGLEVTSGPRSAVLGWEAIVAAHETREFFLFFVARNWAHYLPKRAIGGRASEVELRELLARKLGTRAELAGGR